MPRKKDEPSTSRSNSASGDCNDDQSKEKHGGLFHRFVESFEEALHTVTHDVKDRPKLSSPSVDGVIEFMKKSKPCNIIVMTGAGISTSAGVPDFRSPGTGLYHNLAKYNLSDPMDIFNIGYFLQKPEPFFEVAKTLFPKTIKPTPTHHFVRLLEKKGMLRRWYTQNIDALEFATGIPEDKIVEAHGSYRSSTCLKCKKKYDQKWLEAHLADEDCAVPKCETCGFTVKPDITFFGENLPKRFFTSAVSDFPKCDFLIIIGTSLVVQPFAGMVNEVGDDVPRLLMNMTEAGRIGRRDFLAGIEGLCYGHKENTRDVFWKTSCDDGVREFAEKMGWELELEQLIQEGEMVYEMKAKSKSKA